MISVPVSLELHPLVSLATFASSPSLALFAKY